MLFRMKNALNLLWLMLICLSLTAAGCGSGDNVKVYPVTGKVTFEGKPMERGGSISFIPLESRPGKTAGGSIEPDGTYVMRTYSTNDGSMEGEFRVVINQVITGDPETSADGQTVVEPKEIVPADRQIPAIYSDFKASPLTTQVEAKKNEINFDLTRQK